MIPHRFDLHNSFPRESLAKDLKLCKESSELLASKKSIYNQVDHAHHMLPEKII